MSVVGTQVTIIYSLSSLKWGHVQVRLCEYNECRLL
jgi:hypothetical protein